MPSALPAWLKPSVFVAALLPLLLMIIAAATDRLGPDPAEALMHGSGEWGARLLLLTLAIAPLRAWLGWGWLLQLRRMLGLFSFFYACLHLLLFLNFYLEWSAAAVWEELLERPYIAVGFTAWLLLLPLALTSTQAMQRRLRRNWQRLHRAVYAVAVLVSLHILWQVRSDAGEALVYCLLFAGLLAWRLIQFWKKRADLRNSRLLDAN
ncbi:MAG: protein-methionine-sulfoxide reductase heme-binding subunit MsrQ [Halieaceae bacterium]